MRKPFISAVFVDMSLSIPAAAYAGCDATGGSVPTVAVQALATNNVNAVLPIALASSEPELTTTFAQAMGVRTGRPKAKVLAGRYFMVTAVRLHRAVGNTLCTSLKPAGSNFGPTLPAAEQTLATGKVELLSEFLFRCIEHEVQEHFARTASEKPIKPMSAADMPAAPEHIRGKPGFIPPKGAIYLAINGSCHAEDLPLPTAEDIRSPAEAVAGWSARCKD